ncbi:Palmitoyltransferase zdhhc13 [Entomophthora muscae]|uniref:Palmitoyltransferase zdhhc13 n=1 Tax=Entomophthora muscae TaxID=34485 RepID=A0ACC2TG96_9FUNG|nr:Palmitoyltransferase zdhhc13 [Entomophthora muscae]
MIKKAQVNKTWMGVTPLMYASGQGNAILIQLLLENGANPYYNIPLKHLRVWRKAYSTIGGASLTQFPNSNRTSFGSFSKYFNPESSLEAINPAIESYPVYPLDLASGSLNVTAVQLLASTMSASSFKNDKFGLLLQQSTSISRILLKGGVDPNQVDGVGNSPIHLATMSNRLDLVELLYQHGAQVNLPGIRKSTPLHLAVKFHNPRIALTLVCYGADRKCKDCNGNTPEELGAICGIEAAALEKYFDTSNISSEKINVCFADMLVPIKTKKANFFSPTFLRKWVSMKKSKRESFMSLSFSTDGNSSNEKQLDTPFVARSYSTGSWLSSRPKSAGAAFRDKLATLLPKNH